MNRAERRRAAKTQGKPVMIDAHKAAKWAEKRLREEAAIIRQETTDTLYWSCLWTLHEKYGWSKVRLDRFRVDWLKIVDLIADDRLNTKDIIDTLDMEAYKGSMTSEDEIMRRAGVSIED